MENNGINGLLSLGTYLSCVGGFIFSFVEQHTSAVMACVSIIMYLTSLLFQLLNYRLRVQEVQSASHDPKMALKYSRAGQEAQD